MKTLIKHLKSLVITILVLIAIALIINLLTYLIKIFGGLILMIIFLGLFCLVIYNIVYESLD